MMDKDGRGRNRLSHTSAPLSFAKSKRPVPPDLDEAGTANRLPGGQTVSRRQRSLQPKGQISKYTLMNMETYLEVYFILHSAWFSSKVDQSTCHGDKPRDLCNRLCNTWKLQVNFVCSRTCTTYCTVIMLTKGGRNYNETQPLTRGFNWERKLLSKLPPGFGNNQQRLTYRPEGLRVTPNSMTSFCHECTHLTTNVSNI